MLIAQTNAGYDFPEANRVVHLDAGDTNSYSGSGTTWSDLTSCLLYTSDAADE